jgi:class 3 adenylate cyclase/tetratricopeptide (TPR) repeat protein
MSEERKLVTILFSDVTGSTSLGELLDPEDLRALMGRYYEHAREIVGSFGGTLEKFIGDAVMAVFGLPVTHDDDAERALAAALALRDAIRQDTLLGDAFQLRMGVNTGEVMATTDPLRSDFLVTGDTVNAAARLQQNANPGEIIASERTAQAARMAFVFLEPREIEVKGKQLPLRVFPLKERRSVRLVERPPLVGRKQDLLQLEVLRERTLEEERPQFISIVAPAGTGKTRLLEEFLERLDPIDGFRVAAARCQPYGEGMSYLPLQGFLQDLLGTEASRQQVIDCFAQGGYRIDDALRLADYVLSTLGIGDGRGAADRELVFNAWRLLVETLSRQAPYIIYFENLHWASDSLLDLVEHIASSRVQASLLVIALSRSELLDRRPNWGGGRQSFTALALPPLTVKRSLELVRRLAPALPEAVSIRIAANSGGNPFFAQELVRGLAERGLVADVAAAGDFLPDTIHAAVLARLDLLSRTEREVLQVASVASRTFSPKLLQRVLPAYSTDEITDALAGLLARDMIAPASGGAFTFHNGMVFDITYGTLSRAERIRLHKAVAAALVEEAGDEHIDDYTHVFAYHYYKVAQLSRLSAVPQNLAFETERAITYQVRAGELAIRSGAFEEAQTYFQRAIDLADDAVKVELYEKLADGLGRQWQIKIRDAYQDALALWRALPEPQPLVGARLMRKLLVLNTRFFQGFADRMSREEAEPLWQEAVQLAEQASDEDELWRVRAVALFMQYDLDPLSVEEMRRSERVRDLKQLAAEAASYFERRRDWEALSETLDALTLLQFRSGENSKSIATIQRRLQMPDLSFRERADAISSLSGISLLTGDYDASIQLMADTLDHLHPGEPLEAFANTLNGPIGGLYMTGRWSELPRFQRALDEIWERTKDIPGTGILVVGSYMCLLAVALSHEDQAEIEVFEQKVRKIVPEWKNVDTVPFVEYYRDGDFSQFTVGNRTTDIAGFQMMLFTEHEQCPPDALMSLGSYFADDLTIQASNIVRALAAGDDQALSQAIDEAEEHQLALHAARMRIILAKRTGDLSQIERARPLLERLEDRLFLRKLREVEGQLRVAAGLPTGSAPAV